MKTLVFEVQNPTAGDLVIINAASPKGGKISAKHSILGARKRPQLDENGYVVSMEELPPESPKEIAVSLNGQITKEWMPECVKSRVKPDTGALVLNCTDSFTDVIFTTEVHGGGGTEITMIEY